MRAVASTPSSTGIDTSMITTSGLSAPVLVIASRAIGCFADHAELEVARQLLA